MDWSEEETNTFIKYASSSNIQTNFQSIRLCYSSFPNDPDSIMVKNDMFIYLFYELLDFEKEEEIKKIINDFSELIRERIDSSFDCKQLGMKAEIEY